MAITQAMCTSFKTQLLTGTHDFTNGSGGTFKLALQLAVAVSRQQQLLWARLQLHSAQLVRLLHLAHTQLAAAR